MLTAHTHTNTCSERFYSGKLRLLCLAAGKKARRGFLSLSLSLSPLYLSLSRPFPASERRAEISLPFVNIRGR